LWLASLNFDDIDVIHFYFDIRDLLACHRVKAPVSDQIRSTNFCIGSFFQSKNFLSSSFELISMFIVNWKKLSFKIFIFEQILNYEGLRKNYGDFDKPSMAFKTLFLYFPTTADEIDTKLFGFIRRPTTWNYEPLLLCGIKVGHHFSAFLQCLTTIYQLVILKNERVRILCHP
jgi:hypothetical protein